MGRQKTGIWMGILWLLVVLSACGAGTKKQNAVDCQESCHQHTDRCLGKSGDLCCGLADFWVHIHEDNCYYGNGNLRCQLPQITPHSHGASCYTWQEQQLHGMWLRKQMLICPEKEILLHSHTQACFHKGIWICGKLQILNHRHDLGCFPERTGLKNKEKPSPFLVIGVMQGILAGCLLYLNKLQLEKAEKSLPYP